MHLKPNNHFIRPGFRGFLSVVDRSPVSAIARVVVAIVVAVARFVAWFVIAIAWPAIAAAITWTWPAVVAVA